MGRVAMPKPYAMKPKLQPLKIAGVAAILLPFVAYGITALWFNLAIVPYTDEVELSVSSPVWWQKLGFDSRQ